MKNVFKKLIVTVLAMAMVMGSMVIPAQAAVKSVVAGKSYNLAYNTYYKMVLKEDGYITLSTLQSVYKSTGKTLDGGITIFDKDKTKILSYVYTSQGSMIAMAAGTYYIQSSDYSNNYYTKFSYKFTKSSNGTNFCRAKATALNAKKKVTICQTLNYHYARWYKITLKKNQKLTLTGNSAYLCYASVMDAKGNKVKIDVNKKTNSYVGTTSKLAKGTYYVYFPTAPATNSTGLDSMIGSFLTFSWK